MCTLAPPLLVTRAPPPARSCARRNGVKTRPRPRSAPATGGTGTGASGLRRRAAMLRGADLEVCVRFTGFDTPDWINFNAECRSLFQWTQFRVRGGRQGCCAFCWWVPPWWWARRNFEMSSDLLFPGCSLSSVCRRKTRRLCTRCAWAGSGTSSCRGAERTRTHSRRVLRLAQRNPHTLRPCDCPAVRETLWLPADAAASTALSRALLSAPHSTRRTGRSRTRRWRSLRSGSGCMRRDNAFCALYFLTCGCCDSRGSLRGCEYALC